MMELREQPGSALCVDGFVKWFDPSKGYGFVVSDAGGPDILLHANVLRNFGQGSVADGARIRLLAQPTPRGVQAVEVIEISAAAVPQVAAAALEGLEEPVVLSELPVEPARVKWFDKGKGYGFGNVFGRPEDVFIHMEVLRQSGLADLQPGEAIGLRIVDGRRGRMAVQVLAWDTAARVLP